MNANGLTIGNRAPSAAGSAAAAAMAANAAVLAMGANGYGNKRDDFTAAIATTSTITLASLPAGLTMDASRIVAIGMRPAAGNVDWNWIYQRGSGDLKISYANPTITFDGTPLIVGYDVAVWIEGVGKYDVTGVDGTKHLQVRSESFDIADLSDRAKEIDPIDTHYQPSRLFEVVNGTDGTYAYFMSMATFRQSGLQLELSGGSGTVTAKVYGTEEDTGADPSTYLYQDISLIFGAASWTADEMLLDDSSATGCVSWLKIEIVAASGDDTADWAGYTKRLY